MRCPEVTSLVKMSWGMFRGGFFRRKGVTGKIWYALQQGNRIDCFPVLENGMISEHSDWPGKLNGGERVDVFNPTTLGITNVRWSQEKVME